MNVTEVPPLCFDGVIPSGLATVGADGTPHFTWLSKVFRVDGSHVALSCQFFRQTKANLAARPQAQILLVDPPTAAQFLLDVHWEGSVTEGPLFDRMQQRIMALSSVGKHASDFALQSAEVFKVTGVQRVPVQTEHATARARPPRDELGGLARVAEALSAATDLRTAVDAGLSSLALHLGYERVAIYVHEAADSALYALGSRGFRASGVGARIPLGTGIIGACAQHRLPIRIAEASRELRYERVVLEQVSRQRGGERDIPLPGLEGARSILAVPLALHGRIFGVIAVESELPYWFDVRDEQILITAGQQFAQAIRALDADDDAADAAPTSPAPAPTGALRVRYYEADDSVFINDDYLIKGLPGRILYLLLTLRDSERRETFQNKELRLHPFLKLPSYKDNLESRLLMLQRRLEEKDIPLELDRSQRGKLRVACTMAVALEKVAGPTS